MARKMPPHIVLPNGMWRFVKKGSRATTRKRGKSTMARRKHSRSRGSRGFGLKGFGGIMGGIYHPKGMVDQALVGIGAASVARKFINIHPLQDEAIGFITGGVVGAGSVYVLKNFGTKTSGSASSAYQY